jgi:hypothetical protein
MYNVIKNYEGNENSNGLMLVDMPTGSGKTYSAIEYIFDACFKEENKDRKYIFVTTLKKNLPVEDIKQRFEIAVHKELFQEKVLLIDSNMDSVINSWTPEVERAIPVEIKKRDEYKSFSRDLGFVKKQRERKSADMKEFVASIEANLREKSEPAFRRVVSEYLGKEKTTVEQRLLAIKTEQKWQWLGKLYPAVFTRDRQVLFMSMDKFLSRNTTIVEPSYMFYNSDVIKNAVIFIDEFDATKDTILKKIIDNGLHDKVNYIELFKDIYASLHTDDFPIVLITPSKERQNGKYKTQALESVISGIKEKADYIFETYSLQFKHRTTGEIADLYQNYLFQDHQFHSILNANNSYITMVSDSKQKINSIGFSKSKPELEKSNIQVLLGQLRGFIKYFQGAVNILAINYMQCKIEHRKDGEDTFTMESAIRSVLALFRLSDDSIDYLTSQIMMSSHKIKGDIESADFDLSFYENGFRYYAFENNTEHDMQSQIMMYSFQTTPEKILLRFCEKAKVIGISATATVPSVIGNYDIDYLKSKMQKVYMNVSDEDKQRLADDFNKSQSGYANVKINAELLGEKGNYSESSWLLVFQNKELAQKVYEEIQRLFGENDDKNNFLKERYLRIALAFKQFVIHDDIYSLLCVLNKHPRSGDNTLNRDTLFKMFKYIAKENGWEGFNEGKHVMMLDGAEYDDKKNDLVGRLGAGEKIFVISVYQTIGAGQNLQYPVPEMLKGSLIKVNDRQLREEKDFDAIYLDKPTNLIVPLGNNLEEAEFVKYLFQMEFLQETAEISSSDAILNIKKAFKTYMMSNINNDSFANIYSKPSVVLLSTRYIIQAIGRICRTNQKSKNIYVYADDRIAENIDVSVAEGRIYNPEFNALLDRLRQAGVKNPEEASFEDEASLRSVRVNKEIGNMLSNDWTEAKIERWQALRNLVLTHPTASKEEADSNFIIKNFYARMPEKAKVLYFSQEEDYNNISVSFTSDRDHSKCVSAAGTKLFDMLRISGVRELFAKNGWATDFEPNDYVMTPPLWNNIYKGALGEVVGKYLFERVLKVSVEDISSPDLFELFDYKIENASVFVDFKNWHEDVTADRNVIINKIAAKAKKCDCKCVIVANIWADSNWKIDDTSVEGVRIVSIPYLVKDDNGKVVLDRDAWNRIKESVDEYKDKNE